MADSTVNKTSQLDLSRLKLPQKVQKDYSKMTLEQLEKERASVFSQAQANANYYPELAGQYQFIDKQIGLEIDKKTYGGTLGNSIATKGSQISDLEFALQQNAQKRTILSYQKQTASQQYPELATQYQEQDKKLATEKTSLESQQKIATLKKANLIAQTQTTKPMEDKKQNGILDIIKLLLQPNILTPNSQNQNIVLQIILLLLQGGLDKQKPAIPEKEPDFEIPASWDFENKLRNGEIEISPPQFPPLPESLRYGKEPDFIIPEEWKFENKLRNGEIEIPPPQFPPLPESLRYGKEPDFMIPEEWKFENRLRNGEISGL